MKSPFIEYLIANGRSKENGLSKLPLFNYCESFGAEELSSAEVPLSVRRYEDDADWEGDEEAPDEEEDALDEDDDADDDDEEEDYDDEDDEDDEFPFDDEDDEEEDYDEDDE